MIYYRKECISHIHKECTIKNRIKIGIKQLNSSKGTFFGVIGYVRYIIGQLNIYLL